MSESSTNIFDLAQDVKEGMTPSAGRHPPFQGSVLETSRSQLPMRPFRARSISVHAVKRFRRSYLRDPFPPSTDGHPYRPFANTGSS
jgi:hypothetical protein